MAIYIGILGVMIIIAGIVFSRPSDRKINLTKLMYGACFVSFGVFLLFWASLVKVRTGYLGVVNLNGAIQTKALQSGWHLVNPMAKVIQLDTRTEYDIISKAAPNNKKINDDTISIVSANGSAIKLGLTVVYHVQAQYAPKLYREGGLAYKNKIVDPLSRTLLEKDVQALNINANDKGKLDELRLSLNKELKEELRKHGLNVEKVIVSNFIPNDYLQNTNRPLLLAENKTPMSARSEKSIVFAINSHTAIKNTNNIFRNIAVNTIGYKDMFAKRTPVENTKPLLKLNSTDDSGQFVIDKVSDTKNIATKNTVATNETNNARTEPASTECQPMDENSFGSVKKMIQQTGDNTYQKLTAAEKVITTNCFTSEQVSDFVKLMPTDDAKLEFAKQAYLRTVDRNQYFKVANSFDKKSKKLLGKYIYHLMHRSSPRENNDIQTFLDREENGNAYAATSCSAMDNANFEATKKLIQACPTKPAMLQTAKLIASCNCFTSEQVLDIVKIMPDASAKLEFAEEAFKRTTDRRMFTKVAQILDTNSRKKLDDYVVTLYASK